MDLYMYLFLAIFLPPFLALTVAPSKRQTQLKWQTPLCLMLVVIDEKYSSLKLRNHATVSILKHCPNKYRLLWPVTTLSSIHCAIFPLWMLYDTHSLFLTLEQPRLFPQHITLAVSDSSSYM